MLALEQGLDSFGNLSEQLVAGGVAAHVVDQFELVYVNEQEAVLAVLLARLFGERLELSRQFIPVEQPAVECGQLNGNR